MCRIVAIFAYVLAITLGAQQSWSQVVGSGAPATNSPGNPAASSPGGALGNANPATSGTPDNPNLEATDVNPLDARARDTDLATDPINDPQPVGTAQPTMQSMTTATQQPAPANDWRLVAHNGVWWYWTPNNTWLYYRNSQWNAYVPGDIRRQQVQESRLRMRERYGVGYRGGAAYDANVNPNGQAYPNQGQLQYQGRAGVNMGTNYSGSAFYEQRPISPNAVELQRFQQMQRTTATPFGGTSGGVQDPNLSGSNPVVGGNPIRGGVATPGGTFSNGGVGTSATGGGTASPNPSSGVSGASPNPSSGVSPSSTSTPGNPSAGSTPAGGATGTGGTGTSGAAAGAGGTGS
jgi:hypothetical protein